MNILDRFYLINYALERHCECCGILIRSSDNIKLFANNKWHTVKSVRAARKIARKVKFKN